MAPATNHFLSNAFQQHSFLFVCVLEYPQTTQEDSHLVVRLKLIFVNMYSHMGSSTSHYRELRRQKNPLYCFSNISTDSKRVLHRGFSKLNVGVITGKKNFFCFILKNISDSLTQYINIFGTWLNRASKESPINHKHLKLNQSIVIY